MITRGIVERIVDRYTVKVRMPLLNRIRNNSGNVLSDDLNEAVICTLPKYDPNINTGDVVFVAFEDNDYGKPVVIGYLYRENMNETLGDIVLNTLNVNLSAHLTEDTTIGNVSSEDIANLQGTTGNIQKQLDELRNALDQVQTFMNYWGSQEEPEEKENP